ncbi:MAG: VCBS repeat-containing protein, partial [Planctomycetaceae bacterium]|nr:VCBS repeat-containing protein [Planctomycetaceae bacterium]
MNSNCGKWPSGFRLGALTYRLAFGLLALAIAAGCGNRVKPPPGAVNGSAAGTGKAGAAKLALETLARFTDVADASGVRFTFRDGQEAGHFAIIESLGGGVALFDYDADGTLDLFLPGGGRYGANNEILGLPGALYRNGGDRSFLDVTRLAGVDLAPHYSHGTAVGDYDNDGFPDLLVTGYGGLQLYRNQGDGTFEEAAREAALNDPLWSSSAAWGDLNGDGVLDLFVAHYVNWSFDNHPFCPAGNDDQRDVCPPKKFEGLPDVLYFGVGDGTFRDGSAEAGLMHAGKSAEVSMFDSDKGLGVLLADVDLDGDLDIYVANDTVPKFLYRNRGNGVFDEVGGQSGAALSDTATSDGSMGLDIGDFNNDGLPDLWVANYERESLALYRNEGDCQFLHVSRSAGVTAVGSLFVSFGTLFLDFDRDGDEDIFVTNGHVIRYPVNAPL